MVSFSGFDELNIYGLQMKNFQYGVRTKKKKKER
jgi:hypothetical protein